MEFKNRHEIDISTQNEPIGEVYFIAKNLSEGTKILFRTNVLADAIELVNELYTKCCVYNSKGIIVYQKFKTKEVPIYMKAGDTLSVESINIYYNHTDSSPGRCYTGAIRINSPLRMLGDKYEMIIEYPNSYPEIVYCKAKDIRKYYK